MPGKFKSESERACAKGKPGSTGVPAIEARIIEEDEVVRRVLMSEDVCGVENSKDRTQAYTGNGTVEWQR